jgi:hypothetical protein
MKDGTGWVRAPLVGQRFTDGAGVYWHVRDIIQSPDEGGYYIVRIAFGSTPECTDGVLILNRAEFTALCREKHLRAAKAPRIDSRTPTSPTRRLRTA